MELKSPSATRTKLVGATAIALAVGLAATGCTAAGEGSTGASRETAECTQQANAAIADLTSGKTDSKDAQGQAATSAAELTLSADDIAAIKEMAPTIAVFMHRTDEDAAKAFVAGAEAAIKDYGFNLVTVSSADSDVSKQVADLETIQANSPDGIIGIPLDASATASAWRSVADAGTKLVFTDYAPDGFEVGKDYYTIVANDDRNNGRIDGYLLARGIGCTGEVGLVPYVDHGWFSNYERYLGIKEALADFPDITIVEETEIAGPDFAGDGEKAASAMLTKHPELAGIWSFWATPGSGVVQAVKASGRSDVVTVTNDLTEPAALDILQGQEIYGLASGQYRAQGYTEVTALALGLLGKDVPPYTVLPAYAVDKDNVLQAWKDIYAAEPTQAMVDASK